MVRVPMVVSVLLVAALVVAAGLLAFPGRVGSSSLGSMAAHFRPSSFGTGIRADAIENASPAPPLGLVATIPLQGNPTSPVYDPANGEVYFVNSNNVSVLNGTTLMANLSLSNPPDSITVDTENGFLYVMGVIPYSADRGVVEVVSDGRQIATISTDLGPSGLFDARNGYVYVASDNVTNPYGQDGLVTVLDGTSVLASITVGPDSNLLTYNGQTGEVYVASGGENVTVLNGTSVVRIISLSMTPDDAVYDAESGYVYFAGLYSENITVMHGTTVVGTIAYSLTPRENGLGPIDPRTGDLYVNLITNVSVVRGTSVLDTLPIFRGPYFYDIEDGAIYDNLRGVVEVISDSMGYEPDEVQLFNGTNSMGNISLGVSGSPTGAVYDPASGDTYVTTYAGCLLSSCSTTQEPGYVVVLGFPPAPPSSSGIPGWAYIAIGGVGVGIAFAAIAVLVWSRRGPRSLG
jgi:hypothetical protein